MTATIYDLTFVDNHGQPVQLSDFKGKPLLIVNTASKCGFTPQYDGLQALHETYESRLNHGVTFRLSTKVEVNGAGTHPVFAFLKRRASGLFGGRVKWNFTKFLVAPDGTTVRRFAPNTTPEALRPEIEALLKSQ